MTTVVKRMRGGDDGGGRVLPSHFREDFNVLDGGRLASYV